VPDPTTNLLRLAEAAARQQDWPTCQALSDRILERDLQMANAWMIRGEARFCARIPSGDWMGIRDLAADYRSALDVQEVRSQSLVRFFHQRFLDLVKPPVGELIQQARAGLDEHAAELQPLSRMDMNIFGSVQGFAKANRNARNHEEAKALMQRALPAMAVTREAAQKLMDGAMGETHLDAFIRDLTRTEKELTEAFQSLSEKVDDNTLGDVLFGKWSRKYRT